jgi:hypothetical protein
MAARELDLECPCCGGRLRVDPLTGKVLRWTAQAGERSAAAGTGGLEGLIERAKERDAGREDRLGAAMERERGRERDLDVRFRDATRRAGGGRGPGGAADAPDG